jgi:HD-GYP domain-containing protein (c-di-GMP phosphodiesterase class II)
VSKKNFSIDELQVGMYVELPNSWFSHDFLTNSFKIKDATELARLRKQGFKAVTVDLDRSDIATTIPAQAQIQDSGSIIDPKMGEVPKQWSTDKLMTDDLRNVLSDTHLAPEQKSQAIYRHSVGMMEQLLAFPSIENIKTSKEVIYALSDTVLREEETAHNLLRITSHDFYTYTHSVNVGLTSIMLAKALFENSDAHDLQELAAGFFLHDLGKVKIDPAVLNKPGRLNEREYQHIKTHPYQGYKLLKEANALSEECSIIVMQHHEYVDGSGYPRRLEGDQIHLYGKICAMADVFDALTAERSYKKAMKPFDALSLMKKEMVEHFDKKLFQAFVQLF